MNKFIRYFEYQSDNEPTALIEVKRMIEMQGLTLETIECISSEQITNVPDDWFEDYHMVFKVIIESELNEYDIEARLHFLNGYLGDDFDEEICQYKELKNLIPEDRKALLMFHDIDTFKIHFFLNEEQLNLLKEGGLYSNGKIWAYCDNNILSIHSKKTKEYLYQIELSLDGKLNVIANTEAESYKRIGKRNQEIYLRHLLRHIIETKKQEQEQELSDIEIEK